jgi:DNA polymerase-4
VKTATRRRSILHVDLDSFFVSVERSLDPELRDKPLVIGGEGAEGVVAAASAEAMAQGVETGQSLAAARRLCPEATFRAGDFDAYARVSEEITALLLGLSRRVERPSIDEAYVDLTPEGPQAIAPVQAAERLKDDFQRRLGLDASFGLASSRLAARVASARARPRGLLIVLPGYEPSFLAGQPLSALEELPPQIEKALAGAGLRTLGDVARAEESVLESLVGKAGAARLRESAAGAGEPPIAVAAPPSWIQEDVTVRDRASDVRALAGLLEGLVHRACRRLKPYGLSAGALTIEIERGASSDRRSENLWPGSADLDTLAMVASTLALPLLEPAASVRRLTLRLSRLSRPAGQESLFPPTGSAGA